MATLQNAINANSTTPLELVQGGTQASLTASNGGLVYSNASQMQILAGTATADQIPLSGSSAAPSWSTATYLPTLVANELVYASATNTMAQITTANDGVLITSNTGVPSWLANSDTAGFVLTANSGASPSWQASSVVPALTVETAGPVTLVANMAYAANSASQITFVLPATASVGQRFEILSMNTGGFQITQGAGQQIFMGNLSDTLGATGTVTSNSTSGDWIEIVCVVANNTFYANEKQGQVSLA